jgi:hypothetical protein
MSFGDFLFEFSKEMCRFLADKLIPLLGELPYKTGCFRIAFYELDFNWVAYLELYFIGVECS